MNIPTRLAPLLLIIGFGLSINVTAQREKNFRFAVRYLDNTGKQIMFDTQKSWAEQTYDINFFQSVTVGGRH